MRRIRSRARAGMLLGVVGDVVGYRDSRWEFQKATRVILREFEELSGGEGMAGLDPSTWRASDDTVLHLAAARGLLAADGGHLVANIAEQFVRCFPDAMSGRSPGKTTTKRVSILAAGRAWDAMPFMDRGGGCGAAMRSACVGIRFWREEQLAELVAVAVDAGRLTHHHPVGYLSGLFVAYAAALALRGDVPPERWIEVFLAEALPLARRHVESAGREVALNLAPESWDAFPDALRAYEPPPAGDAYSAEERAARHYAWSHRGWPGASGTDCVLIALDALLWSAGDWDRLCLAAVLHGGDNDSTGTVAAAWFGLVYGLGPVPEVNYAHVEFGVGAGRLGVRLASAG